MNNKIIKNHKELFLLYAFNQGLHWFSMGILIPVMVLTLLDFGYNIGQIGTAMSIMSVTVLLLEMPTGGFADTLGRKPVYLISVIFYILGYSFMLFASSFLHLTAVVVLIGVGRALSSGTMDAWFIDEHKRLGGNDELLQKDLAKAGVVIPASLGAGTLVGGIIPDLAGTFRMNLVVMILLYCLQLFLTSILIKEDRDLFVGRLTDGFKAFPTVLSSAVKYGIKQRNVMSVLAATTALGIGLAGLEQLWQPRVREISPDSGAWVFGVVSAGYFLSASIGSGLSTILLRLFKQQYKLLLFCFRFLMAGLYILLAFVYGLAVFVPVYLLLFLFHGVTGSPEMTVFNRDVPADKRSSLLSLNSLFLQAGGALGSFTAGQLAFRAGIPAAWKLSGMFLVASAFAYLMIKEKKHENKI